MLNDMPLYQPPDIPAVKNLIDDIEEALGGIAGELMQQDGDYPESWPGLAEVYEHLERFKNCIYTNGDAT